MNNSGKPGAAPFRLLTLAAMALLAMAFFSPIWWVALTAPQYPADAFPDGIRIEFHFNGVMNGCHTRPRAEIESDETLDCVHEMNTINHYIGMKPIAEGAKFEIALAPYIFIALGLMLVAFMFYSGPLWWLLALPAILVPLGFVIDYSGWLWYFGHTLSPMGAFTVKPFMPTVFGEGKVAQFSTFSYPTYGFGLLVASSLALVVAVLLRRKQLRAARGGQ
ncbi:hypothetical protein [Rhodoblastus sp.]|uniref:hypothetical protein n=1 Tax=Rhodoblastus sp. TaxID=1962975 RepID=UPI002604040D|nr:hypothetical protein [Rhodoblastus sp.]